MAFIVDLLHIVACLGLIAVIMFQTTKSEGSGGALGWGTIGGKASASIHMPVGLERYLQPITFWLAVTFLVTSILTALPAARMGRMLTFIGPAYIILLVYGRQFAARLRKALGGE